MTVAPVSSGISTDVQALRLCEWRLGPGQPTLVMDQFSAEGFHVMVDDRGDVHVGSKDGRFYTGWFPAGRPETGEGWKIAVTGAAHEPGHQITFDPETPADIVAAAVNSVLELLPAGARIHDYPVEAHVPLREWLSWRTCNAP